MRKGVESMAQRKKTSSEPLRKIRPATTPEAREAQLVALAYDRVEQRLIDGTASGQEITAIIKLGSEKAKLEREKLIYETEVLKSKKQVLDAQKRTDEMYTRAMEAMKSYMGIEEIPDDPYIL